MVAVPDFELQSYTGEENWLTTCQKYDVRNPLYAVSQTYKNKLMQILETGKYQYNVGLMTLVHPAS